MIYVALGENRIEFAANSWTVDAQGYLHVFSGASEVATLSPSAWDIVSKEAIV